MPVHLQISAAVAPELIAIDLPYTDLLVRLLINLFSAVLLIRFIYYPIRRRRNYLFNFLLFNSLVFLICLMLSKAALQLGFAFGLFAIFSIMRFRTISIPMKEMAYFFAAMAIGVINALAVSGEYYLILIGCNTFVLILTLALEKLVPASNEVARTVIYEKIELIVPDKRDALLADLRQRTGLAIHRIDIRQINLLRDIALIDVYYYSEQDEDADESIFDSRSNDSLD